MASITWANNHQKQLTNSVVFSNTNAPSNVGLNKFLQPAVQYIPAVKTKKAKKPVELVYTNSIPPPPGNKGISITKLSVANAERKHKACMQMMANRRAKSASKSRKEVHMKKKTRKTRKTRKTNYS